MCHSSCGRTRPEDWPAPWWWSCLMNPSSQNPPLLTGCLSDLPFWSRRSLGKKKKKGRQCVRPALNRLEPWTFLLLCLLVCHFLFYFNQSRSSHSKPSTHALTLLLPSLNLRFLLNLYSSLNLILVLIFHVYNTTTTMSPVFPFPFNTHQSHPGRWFGGSEASGWMTRCAVP